MIDGVSALIDAVQPDRDHAAVRRTGHDRTRRSRGRTRDDLVGIDGIDTRVGGNPVHRLCIKRSRKPGEDRAIDDQSVVPEAEVIDEDIGIGSRPKLHDVTARCGHRHFNRRRICRCMCHTDDTHGRQQRSEQPDDAVPHQMRTPCITAAATVFSIRHATVRRPVPPGIGVTAPAIP